MHLIEIAEIVRDVRPGLAEVEGFALKGRLKSDDSREELRAHTHVVNVEGRREFVHEKVRYGNRLTAHLKMYFAQAKRTRHRFSPGGVFRIDC